MKIKKIGVVAALALSANGAAMATPSTALEDSQNLWIQSCKVSYSKRELATYDPMTGFLVAIHTMSQPIYKIALAAAADSASPEHCKNPSAWIESTKFRIMNY